MRFSPNVFDVWVFRSTDQGARFLLMYTSTEKAERYFNGGRFWQVPSGFVRDGESLTNAVLRELAGHELQVKSIWAGEHAYIIYNRRYEEMQIVGVYAAEVEDGPVRVDPLEHSEYGWFSVEECVARARYRGLRDGVRSVHEYITAPSSAAKELCLYERGRA